MGKMIKNIKDIFLILGDPDVIIQHIAETPVGMVAQKDFVNEYMSTLPENWDDVKFVDGIPCKYIVLARKKGDRWYIAGING